MLGSLIVVFREVVEAGLIVGIVMAVTRGVHHRGLWVSAGVTGGVLGACLVAASMNVLSAAFEGVGQELFNAAILGLAVVMLAWHNIWMARHGRELASEMRAVGQAVAAGTTSLAGLATVVGIAVLREGSEVALFLYGLSASEGGGAAGLLAGGVLGLVLGGLVGVGTYLGLVRIPGRYLFGVTSALIAFLAAGMAAQTIAFLQQANAVSALNTPVWDTSEILSDSSLLGRALHTLLGYTDQPTGMQVIAYALTLATIFVLMKVLAPEQRAHGGQAATA